MEYSDFYLLSDSGCRGALNVATVSSSIGKYLDDFAILRQELIPSEPIIWRRNIGSIPKDCISTGYATLMLFSEHFFELLFDCAFTGWNTYSCVIYGKNNELISGYKGLSITGSCGKLDRTLWHQEMRYNPVGKLRPIWVGLYFDLRTWDGSDFFCS